ncbi:MAG: AraC family transcriptional regulator [Clostridia bacterium]|nr:AraC family transcriptional regulator [Clostridia bacterium]
MIILISGALHENTQRGTPDFPIEFYHLTERHPSYQMRYHWHKDFEIVRVLEGSLTLQLNGESYRLEAGEGLFIPGGIVHGGIAERCIYQCLVFSPSLLYAVPKCRAQIKAKLISPTRFTDEKLLGALFECFFGEENDKELEIMGYLYSITYKAVSLQSGRMPVASGDFDKLKGAITFIEENYHRPITLAELAASCSMSPNYFCRCFKQITAQTPIEYLAAYRIECACKQLLSGESVTECAYSCGFKDLSYFISVFKAHTGMPPKKYAAQHQVK